MRIRLYIDVETDEQSRAQFAERVVNQPLVTVILPGFGEFTGRFTGATQTEPA